MKSRKSRVLRTPARAWFYTSQWQHWRRSWCLLRSPALPRAFLLLARAQRRLGLPTAHVAIGGRRMLHAHTQAQYISRAQSQCTQCESAQFNRYLEKGMRMFALSYQRASLRNRASERTAVLRKMYQRSGVLRRITPVPISICAREEVSDCRRNESGRWRRSAHERAIESEAEAARAYPLSERRNFLGEKRAGTYKLRERCDANARKHGSRKTKYYANVPKQGEKFKYENRRAMTDCLTLFSKPPQANW